MIKLFIDLLLLWGILLATTILCAGWGTLTLRLLCLPAPVALNSTTVWLGFAMTLGAVEFLHLFFAVDWKLTLFFMLVGLGGCLSATGMGQQGGFTWPRRVWRLLCTHRWYVLLALVIIVLWSLRAMGTPNNFDSGLYHFGSIRWLNESPIVLGLGNLHWRLALNQSYFGFLALLNVAPYWDHGYAAGGLFLLMLSAATLLESGATRSVAWRWVIGAVLFVFMGYVASTTVNPSPDSAVTLIEIGIFLLLLRVASEKDAKPDQNITDLAVAVCLSLAVVTIKLSSLVFAILSMVVAVILYLKSTRPHHRVLLRLIALLALLGLVHLGRGYLLSGAPFFPVTIAGAWGLDWAVPQAVAQYESDLIFSWARAPGELTSAQVLGNWGWLEGWLRTLPILAWLTFGVASLLTTLNFIALRKTVSVVFRAQYLLYLPLFGSLIFWFLTAPDIRFLGAVHILYLALASWIFVSNLCPNLDSNRNRNLYPNPNLNLEQEQEQEQEQNFARATINKLLSQPVFFWIMLLTVCLLSLKLTGLRSLSDTGWKAIPTASVAVHTTESGADIFVPVDGSHCWNAALPCASIFNQSLKATTVTDSLWRFLPGSDRKIFSVNTLERLK